MAEHISDLSLGAYHARPEWSHSQMEVLLQSPPLFHGRFISGVFPRESSDAMDDGSIVHAVLTGGESFDDLVAIIPDEVLSASGARRGKAWQEWSAEHAGKIQRKREECSALLAMIDSVRAHAKARWLLDVDGPFEHSIIWHDDDSGLDLRARPDKASCVNGEHIIVDLKTTRVTDHRGFSADMVRYGYHRQAAWYWDAAESLGWHVPAFCFISVDKTPAHESHVYELAPAAVEVGRQENRELLRELAWRLATNNWGSRDNAAIIEIDIPTWAYNTTQEWRILE